MTASDGCQQSAATKAASADLREGSHSWQRRPAKSESQYRSSASLLHSWHSPEVFFIKGLIAKLILILWLKKIHG
jgi:hypothetical protein